MTARIRLLGLLVMGACMSLTGGCVGFGPGGSLSVESRGPDPVVLHGRYVTALYNYDAPEISFYLSDVPLDDLLEGRIDQGHLVHLNLLWLPLAGQTPVDPSAANVTIRYVVFVDGEVGIYGGAGFALPRGKAGDRSMGVDVGEALVELLDRTDGFVDVLGPARVTGSFTARLDDGQIRQLRHAVNQMVTNALGRTRLVDAEAVGRQLTAILSAP